MRNNETIFIIKMTGIFFWFVPNNEENLYKMKLSIYYNFIFNRFAEIQQKL